MHPLAHAWARDRLHESGKQGAWACTSSLIALSTEGDREYQDFWRLLQPHVESCIDASPGEPFKLYPAIEIGRMFYQFAWLFLRGEDHLRVKALTGTLWKEFDAEISSVKSGPLILLLYAKCLSCLAEVDPAKAIFENIVYSDKGTTRVTDETRLLAKTELADIYRIEGKYQVSIDMLREVIQMRRTSSNPGTTAALRAYNRLVSALVADGQNKEAISLLQEEVVVQIEKSTLDPTHPDRCDSQRVFAGALLAAGENKEAITLLREVIQTEELTLKPTHPHSLASKYGLARALLADGENKEATSLLREVVQIKKSTLNPTHPELLDLQHELARALLEDGENKEAISLLREVIQIKELTLNPTHPSLLVSKQCLASGLREIGEIGEALEIIQAVFSVVERLWEPSDPRRKYYEWLLSACLADKEKLAATSMTIPIREDDKGRSGGGEEGGEGRRRGKRK
jgi:tetratricopeptide (TPR) repeat protein